MTETPASIAGQQPARTSPTRVVFEPFDGSSGEPYEHGSVGLVCELCGDGEQVFTLDDATRWADAHVCSAGEWRREHRTMRAVIEASGPDA